MSTAEELSASAPKDTACTIPEAPQQRSADNAGGDAQNASPAAATPSAGDSDTARVDKQRLRTAPGAPCSAHTSLAPTDADKREDVRRNTSGRQSMYGGPVVYVRVPVGQGYPPPEYYREKPPSTGGWGGGGGGGGGGGRAHQLRLLSDGEWEEAGAFSEAAVRRAFIRKVYAILSLQLALTLGIIAIFMFVPSVKQFVLTHVSMLYVAMALFITIYLTLVCCGDVRKQHPCNIILLFIFTLSFSYLLGVTAALYSTYIVFMAVAMTTVIALLVTMVATFSKVDFTGCAALLCVLTLGVVIFGIVAVLVYIFSQDKNFLLMAIYAGLVCILSSLYLMFDTQLIMGGRYMELSPDEYIYAALQLYVDIGNILWSLLLLLGYCFSD